jgi:hypothetical protein
MTDRTLFQRPPRRQRPLTDDDLKPSQEPQRLDLSINTQKISHLSRYFCKYVWQRRNSQRRLWRCWIYWLRWSCCMSSNLPGLLRFLTSLADRRWNASRWNASRWNACRWIWRSRTCFGISSRRPACMIASFASLLESLTGHSASRSFQTPSETSGWPARRRTMRDSVERRRRIISLLFYRHHDHNRHGQTPTHTQTHERAGCI